MVMEFRKTSLDEHLLVARTSPGQNMQGEQGRVGDFSKQSDCPDSGHHA
ncbi:unnamed protein product [marine sediment metagenome]|uniref:Uncharacterized protein n=1 Tax=marine sediment metagenome TaxID=412755 RepID=X0U3J8_9ZZZZ